ncbi:MAG: hypothetical protein GQ534_06705 [Candidatus Delongbacteria bacterium]|nr:hypothetical protein [Candidatus Delongbacteria bacterium]
MDPEKFVTQAIMAITATLAKKGIDVTIDKVKELIANISKQNPSLRGQFNIDEVASKIQVTTGNVGRIAYNEETLARYLEIPIPDIATLNTNNIEMNVLYDHVRLETEFGEWLSEWGYKVQLGETLTGLRGIEYTPDVYGVLSTLHGQYEICISFVCDNPPNEDRVYSLLGKIEAYAEGKKSFDTGDIFIIISPNRFTQGAINAIALQNEQEHYYVFTLDGGDIYVLENSRSPSEQLDELRDKVREAEEQSKRAEGKRVLSQ